MMNMIIYRIDKNYGGMQYVEYDMEENIYKKGDTNAHGGHWDKRSLRVKVSTVRELKEFEEQIVGNGAKHVWE